MSKPDSVRCYDAVMKRTTVSLPDDLALRLEREAARRSVSEAEVVRSALAQMLGGNRSGRRPLPFPPLGDSGRSDISERFDEYLAASGFGEDALRR